jgi:ATP-dependent protease ClpP protease subunit
LTLVGEKNFENKKRFMPIGTPKVSVIRSYRNSKNKISKKKVFITIREKFREERVLFLCRNIEYPMVNEFIALILLMDLEKESNIYLYKNSEDGGPLSAMALYDTIQLSRFDICTMNIKIYII